jgi:twitching motility protein PilT
VNLINETKRHHVLTMEDPIEFVYPVRNCLINQREIPRHSRSFADSLRAALREDPDVIVVGEMRDNETVRLALTAAETGHLVIASMHTTSAAKTVDRLIECFPPDEQNQVRTMISESLVAIITQSLMRRQDGKGMVAAFEILKHTLSLANLIREEKTLMIPSLMQTGKNVGMQTLDDALMALVQAGAVHPEQAYLRAEKKETFQDMVSPGFLESTFG